MGDVDVEVVRGVAARDARAGAAAGLLTAAVVDAVREARLFKLYLPAELDGLGLGLPEACSVIARLAEIDGATGWAVMIGAGANWFAGAMSPALARQVFGAPDSVVAGSGAPGTATPVSGGWRVTGRWLWCSGAPWATWFTFTATTPTGEVLAFAVPAAEVSLRPDTWDVRGLRATASWEASLNDLAVPAVRTFRLDQRSSARPEPIFGVPFEAFAQTTMAAVSVGLARRCLAEFGVLARGKRPSVGGPVLASDPVVRDRVARATAAARAAASYLAETTAALWAACGAGDEPGGGGPGAANEPSAGVLTDVQLAAGHAVEAGAQTASAVWDLAGMSVLANQSTLGRVIADLHAASQNAAVSRARFASVGASLLSG